jgi:TonB dependent receptor/TonB-dependent Receptor Plug Domain
MSLFLLPRGRFRALTTLSLFPWVATGLVRADESEPPTSLDTVVVYGRSIDLTGEATSSSTGRVGAAEIAARPFLRRGELLEVVPGVVITQHSGSGKANQYFLRGFNLDHGTDFAVSVDDMPVNMRTHAHGQGYADLNFIIPEFVESITYQKGLYSAENGDFSAAGAAQFHLVNSLTRAFTKIEIGEDEFARIVAGSTVKTGAHSSTTVGMEAAYANGPWDNPEHGRRFNAMVRHTWSSGSNEFALTALGYHGDWDSTDQVPLRAINNGLIGLFGAIDPSDGGRSSRASLSFDWKRRDPMTSTKLNLYAICYRLNLFSNFTYALDNPVDGDQFNQRDQRGIFGGTFERTWNRDLAGRKSSTSIGAQVREDLIDVGLFHTVKRNRIGTTRNDEVREGSLGIFAKNTLQLTQWLRLDSGLRVDGYHFKVDSDLPANSGTRSAVIISPKVSLIFGPWKKTELYLNAGEGFHSNDARGTTIAVDPSDASVPVDRVNPLVRAKSVEAGVRTSVLPGLVSTVSLWALDLDSELLFVGDGGATEPNGPTRRYGVELANFYRVNPWLALDADVAFTHGRYREDTGDGTRIPNSLSTVVTAGAAINLPTGWFGAIRTRYFGRQPLIEGNSIVAPSSLTYNGRIGWRGRDWEIALDVLNLLDRPNYDIAYYYESQLPGEASPVADIHLHPAESRTFRMGFTRRF